MTATSTGLPAASRTRLVALIGPPNSGKTTLFNRLTGLRQKVANYPGVTVERHVGRAQLGEQAEVDLLDLPGVYSLHPRTEDEKVTSDVLLGKMPDLARPDAVLLILDSTNLGHNLALVAPILALGLPTMVVLNMADDLGSRGGSIELAALSAELGVPVALVSAVQGVGLDTVRSFLRGPAVAARVTFPILQNVQDAPHCRRWAASVTASAGYRAPSPPAWTRRLDATLLHRVWGPAILTLLLIAIWWMIFAGAKPAMDLVELAISSSGSWLKGQLPDTLWRGLLIDGVWAGVGSIVVFLPQILILSLFIGILEDSGYMARAALIADRALASVGLQGKAVIPLVSALACAVPAIMGARMIESKRDRLATIMVAPFMVCSARLPVYTLLIAAFVPGAAWMQAMVLAGLYVLGAVAAFATARLLKSTILKSERMPFVLEMPPYRWPTFRSLSLRLVDRTRVFLRRAGTIILGVAVVLWLMATLPLKPDGSAAEVGESIAGTIGKTIEPAIRPLGFNWKIGVGLITSLAAREVIVSTLGTIYGIESTDEDAIKESLRSELQRDLTPGAAAALIVFFAFAMQCMSTVAVIRRETGGWKWPVLQFTYMLALAYSGAWVANQLTSWLTSA
ncbi:MAG: ferrous iron transporter B [Acidobacteria bacterium]|nr:ferrous iron transporter B [Acidobacteriota bacterium]